MANYSPERLGEPIETLNIIPIVNPTDENNNIIFKIRPSINYPNGALVVQVLNAITPIGQESAAANLPISSRSEYSRAMINTWKPGILEKNPQLANAFVEDDEEVATRSPDVIQKQEKLLDLAALLRDTEIRTDRSVDLELRRQPGSKKKKQANLKKPTIEEISRRKLDTPQTVEMAMIKANSWILIQDYLMKPHGIEDLLNNMEIIEEVSNLPPKGAINLIKIAEQLLDPNLEQEIPLLRYKEGVANLHTVEQAGVLRQIIESAFLNKKVHGKIDSRPPLDRQLNAFSTKLLDFYWDNAGSLYGTNEPTPLAALTYDLLFASSYDSNETLTSETTDWLIGKIIDQRYTKQFFDQFAVCSKKGIEQIHEVVKNVIKDVANHSTVQRVGTISIADVQTFLYSQNQEYYESYFQKSGGNSLHGIFHDRNVSLGVAFFQMMQRKDEAIKNIFRTKNLNTVAMFGDSRQFELPQKVVDFIESEFSTRLSMYLHKRYGYILLDSLLTNLWKPGFYLEMKAKKVDQPEDTVSRSYLQSSALESFKDQLPEARESLVAENLLWNSFYYSLPNTDQEIESIRQENRESRRKIRYENMWFVAENGDEFNARNNTDLEEYDLQAVRFYPHKIKENPGFRAELVTNVLGEDGKPLVVTLLVDRNSGMLLDASGHTMILNSSIYQKINQFVLERLNYITSGARPVEDNASRFTGTSFGNLTEVNEDSEKDGMTRRAYWMELESTVKRTITLKSPSARRHARYVKDTWGISIMDENRSRWRALTLKNGHFVTFVPAITNFTRNPRPNQLKYVNGELIRLPS